MACFSYDGQIWNDLHSDFPNADQPFSSMEIDHVMISLQPLPAAVSAAGDPWQRLLPNHFKPESFPTNDSGYPRFVVIPALDQLILHAESALLTHHVAGFPAPKA